MLLRSSVVFRVSSVPIHDGAVVVRSGRIQAVDAADTFVTTGRDDVVNLPDMAILPGLVNAHTHLELSRLGGKWPRPACFTDWLRKMIGYNHGLRKWPWWRWQTRRSVRAGLAASVAAGTTLVGDISSTGLATDVLSSAAIRSIVFLEALGWDPTAVERTGKQLWSRIEPGPQGRMRRGVSPHAPYSTTASLYESCHTIADQLRCQLATHLSETPEELEFCQAGTGPLRELLDELAVLPEGWEPPGRSPVGYVESLGVFDRGILVAHGNYLADGDVAILKKSGSAVVYCPRSHDYFGHARHPFRELMEAGVTVALGTDSLASSPSLSILDEMRFLHGKYPDLPPVKVLELGTLAGATALRTERHVGTIEPGKRADLVAVKLGSDPSRDPYEALLHPDTRVMLVLCDGHVAYDPLHLVPDHLHEEAAAR